MSGTQKTNRKKKSYTLYYQKHYVIWIQLYSIRKPSYHLTSNTLKFAFYCVSLNNTTPLEYKSTIVWNIYYLSLLTLSLEPFNWPVCKSQLSFYLYLSSTCTSLTHANKDFTNQSCFPLYPTSNFCLLEFISEPQKGNIHTAPLGVVTALNFPFQSFFCFIFSW